MSLEKLGERGLSFGRRGGRLRGQGGHDDGHVDACIDFHGRRLGSVGASGDHKNMCGCDGISPDTRIDLYKGVRSNPDLVYDGVYVVCTKCGRVHGQNDVGDVFENFKSPSAGYKRKNHFNQVLLAWARSTANKMDVEIFRYLLPYAISYKIQIGVDTFKKFKKCDVQRLFRAVELPLYLQEKHRSTKFKKKRLKKLTMRKQYTMRWWGYVDDLVRATEDSNYVALVPGEELLVLLSASFEILCTALDPCKHEEKCDGRGKNCSCGKAVITCYYAIKKILQIISPSEYKKWKDAIPNDRCGKVRACTNYWNRMMKHLKWPESLLSALRLKFPGNKILFQ